MAYDYLERLLKGKLGGNNPLFNNLFGNAQRKIGRVTDRNVRKIKEQGAQSGFRGINANQINDAYRTESDTLGEVSGQIDMMKLQDEQDTIKGLLGIEQIKSQETGFGDVLGGILGMIGGGFAGGVGGKAGAKWFS